MPFQQHTKIFNVLIQKCGMQIVQTSNYAIENQTEIVEVQLN